MTLPTELDVFYMDHHRCGDLEAGVEGPVVWFDCDCGARIARRADHVALRRWLSGVAAELAAGTVAGEEVGQLGEQHGVRIGRLGDGVNVQIGDTRSGTDRESRR